MLTSNQLAEAVAILSLSAATVCPPIASWMDIREQSPQVKPIDESPQQFIDEKRAMDSGYIDELTLDHPAHTTWCEASRILRELEHGHPE
jgi:hypothetical protein